ncbi:hypothetical protein [Streptomyces agglomeratus]|uniref:hypothetical protein n=1 Tax=Streptomyces agglomeratus TaxID=285458 RepID=UPI00159F1473|nr:hypothetical protein [Streptomyces agglomeratus]
MNGLGLFEDVIDELEGYVLSQPAKMARRERARRDGWWYVSRCEWGTDATTDPLVKKV